MAFMNYLSLPLDSLISNSFNFVRISGEAKSCSCRSLLNLILFSSLEWSVGGKLDFEMASVVQW